MTGGLCRLCCTPSLIGCGAGSCWRWSLYGSWTPSAQRHWLIQLAWLWLRYQPGSALAVWFRERVGTLQSRTRRIAIVAMARKLLVALWRYVETGTLPEGIEIWPQAAAVADRIAGRWARPHVRL